MVGFYEFVEKRGSGNIRDLVGFIQKFVDDPSVYLELSAVEKVEVEKKLDAVLDLFTEMPGG